MVLTVVGFTMVLPFLWMLSTSLKTRKGALEIPPTWIPREHAAFARIDLDAGSELRKILEEPELYKEPVRVRILSETAQVRRLDNDREMTVYRQALELRKPWWNPWAAGQMTARLRENDESFRVPVEVLSSGARVRVIEEGRDLNKVVDVPGDAVYTKSWVSL